MALTKKQVLEAVIQQNIRDLPEEKLREVLEFVHHRVRNASVLPESLFSPINERTAKEALHNELLNDLPYRPSVSNLPPPVYLKMFEEICGQMLDLTRRKNADYTGDSGDAFANFRVVEDLGLASVEVGILTRMSDKFSRISSLLKKAGQVKDESMEDTILDLAVYSVILLIYRRQLIRS